MPPGQGFGAGDIQHRRADHAIVDGGDQIILNHLQAPARIDEDRTGFHPGEGSGVIEIGSLRGQRQDGNQIIRLPKAGDETIIAVTGINPGQGFGRAGPPDGAEPHHGGFLCHDAANGPQPHHRDAVITREALFELDPFLTLFQIAIGITFTVFFKDGKQHPFGHGIGHERINQPRQFQVRGKGFALQDMVNTLTQRNHAFQVVVIGDQSVGGIPGHQHIGLIGIRAVSRHQLEGGQHPAEGFLPLIHAAGIVIIKDVDGFLHFTIPPSG